MLPPPRPVMDSVGSWLRQARKEQGLTLESVARSTRISHHQLESLEHGRYDELPGDIYARGFIRSYARAVGLDDNEALVQFSSERRARTTTLHPAKALVAKKGRPVGLLVACSVFLLLLAVATLAITRPRTSKAAPGELSTTASAHALIASS